jgi:3-oxoacyl-(acyl-carrier-protein) synthase/N-acetylglutamate synthase-like GNAT family acetyltransferase
MIRNANLRDVPALVELEKRCWKNGLNMGEDIIFERIQIYPEYQHVLELEGAVCGVLYTQRVPSLEDCDTWTYTQAAKAQCHDPQGPLLQLVSIAVDSKCVRDGAMQLRNYALTKAREQKIEKVVAVTRCDSFTGGDIAEYKAYIATERDATIFFHTSGGAVVREIVRNYRPEDVANFGCGVLIEYSISANAAMLSLEQILAKVADVKGLPNDEALDDLAEDSPLLHVLDSLQLLTLHNWLEEMSGKKLHTEFLFKHFTAKKICDAFVESSERVAAPLPAPFTLSRGSLDIAVVGIGMKLPGCIDGIDELWAALSAKKVFTGKVPSSRAKQHYGCGEDKSGAAFGNYFEEVDHFDPDYFGMSASEAMSMDPSHRALLECVAKAIADSGKSLKSFAGTSTGIFVGMSATDYSEVEGANYKDSGSVFSATGGALAMAAGRISFLLGLHGPSLVIDTACSSSLVAIHQAASALHQNQCSTALVASVNLILAPLLSQAYAQAGMLSPDGKCHTFDEAANGYCRAEGCGAVVLKRLQDAQRDGDSIYAVIKGSAVMHHGHGASLTAPNVDAQVSLLRAALYSANLRSEDMTSIEAHGTGTKLGDPIEIGGIATVFGEVEQMFVTSVKANVGHLEAAAGMAGLFAAIASMKHHVIAPNAALVKLNGRILERIQGTGIAFPTDPAPHQGLMRIGVSSFGYSGTIAHIIVEEARSQSPDIKPRNVRCFRSRLFAHVLTALAILGAKDYVQTEVQSSVLTLCFRSQSRIKAR